MASPDLTRSVCEKALCRPRAVGSGGEGVVPRMPASHFRQI